MNYMFTNCDQKIANEWQKYKGYTVRPVDSTVDYYLKLVRQYALTDANMMYGGTPEIRTIFQQENRHVTIVDRCEQIIHGMGLLTQSGVAIAQNENFQLCEWLELQTLSQSFDFMIGDDAINMVKWQDFDRFLMGAHQVLNKRGIFVCHLLLKPDDVLIDKSVKQIVDEYYCGKIKSQYDLASRLNFICYDHDSYAMGWQQTISQLGAKNLDQFKPDLDFVATFGLLNSRFYCPRQKEFERLVTRYFKVKEIFYPTEHEYCLYEPVYVLEKI